MPVRSCDAAAVVHFRSRTVPAELHVALSALGNVVLNGFALLAFVMQGGGGCW